MGLGTTGADGVRVTKPDYETPVVKAIREWLQNSPTHLDGLQQDRQ